MYKYVLIISSFFISFQPGFCQSDTGPIRESDPASVRVSQERLNRLDQFIRQYIENKQLNGATALIVREGRIVYHKAFGYSNLEQKTAMQKDQIFRIASMTKPVVSVAAMILWEEGRFSLDDPVSKFIPEFEHPKVLDRFNPADTTFTTSPAKGEITIRHLLTHTSGIGYAQIGSPFANAIYFKHRINGGIGTPYSTLRETIPRLAKLPLFNQPGEKFLYGLNTDVLGYLVEVISGMSLDRFIEEKICRPLGMKDTYFFLPNDKQSRLTNLYMQDDQGELRLQKPEISLNGVMYRDFPNTRGGTYLSGGAGLSSTAYDYAIFCQMLLNGGIYNGVRILSPHTIRMMTTNQIGNLAMWDNPDNPNRFGLGFGVYTDKSESHVPVRAGSFDWAGMFASHFWIDPQTKLVVVFMRNVWPTRQWDFGDRVKQVVYQAITD
jgi:CubicO group peptidase (beta-lactamase class C family)